MGHPTGGNKLINFFSSVSTEDQPKPTQPMYQSVLLHFLYLCLFIRTIFVFILSPEKEYPRFKFCFLSFQFDLLFATFAMCKCSQKGTCCIFMLLCHIMLLCYYVALLQQTNFCFGVQVGVTDVHRFPKGIAWQSLPTSLDLILLPLSPFISTKVKTDVRISFRSESSSLPSASHHHHHCHHQHHHHHHHLSPMPSASQLQHQFFSNLR